jgi:hypothetical protein
MPHGGPVAHYIYQITAGTVYRQKRKQGKQGYHGPDRLVSFEVM